MGFKTMSEYVAGKSKDRTIAAFLIGGRLRVMPLSGDRFESMSQDYLHRCLGVYRDAPAEYVYDDLKCLAKHESELGE